jgi:hypothetical protein
MKKEAIEMEEDKKEEGDVEKKIKEREEKKRAKVSIRERIREMNDAKSQREQEIQVLKIRIRSELKVLDTVLEIEGEHWKESWKRLKGLVGEIEEKERGPYNLSFGTCDPVGFKQEKQRLEHAFAELGGDEKEEQ